MADAGQDQASRTGSMLHRTKMLRVAGFILLASLFLWLPFEDHSLLFVHLFAISITLWISVYLLSRFRPQGVKSVIIYPLTGIIAGVGVTLLVTFLMIFKNGIHGHPNPDFVYDDLVRVISRSHIWVIAGLIIGSGLSLLKLTDRVK